LRWWLEWGPHLEGLKKVEDQTGEKPRALLNRPRLSQWEQAYYEAYERLMGSRQWTFGGAAGIPVSEIVAYFELQGIVDDDERAEYMSVIQALDAEYLKWHKEKHVK
jgi:hypothetical protein